MRTLDIDSRRRSLRRHLHASESVGLVEGHARNLELLLQSRCIHAEHHRPGTRVTATQKAAVRSVTVKTEPCPGWLVTLIVPPCASTMARLIGKPMPVPEVRVLCESTR